MSLNLAAVVMRRALALKDELGFGWIASAADPFPYEDNRLRAMVEKITSLRLRYSSNGMPFPVFSGDCDHSVYRSATANIAFRFWHDMTHVKYGLGFSTADELVVAKLQLDEIKDSLTPEDQALFTADTMGQSHYFAATGGFPKNQRHFGAWVAARYWTHQTSIQDDVSLYLKEFPHDALTSPQAD